MATEKSIDPIREKICSALLPWLLAAAMLAIYCADAEPWVSVFNLMPPWPKRPAGLAAGNLQSADVPVHLSVSLAAAGANSRRPEYFLRRVRGADAGFAGAVGGACCRMTARKCSATRERSDFAYLTTRSAWLPPVLAVLVCGLQFTFWEHATNFTGEC
jgi:hypothetical protein